MAKTECVSRLVPYDAGEIRRVDRSSKAVVNRHRYFSRDEPAILVICARRVAHALSGLGWKAIHPHDLNVGARRVEHEIEPRRKPVAAPVSEGVAGHLRVTRVPIVYGSVRL